MNKSHLCTKVADHAGLSKDTVETVLDSLEYVVIQTLEQGDQLHWGGFFRAWTILKRPATRSGGIRNRDTPTQKIRYVMPCCSFGSKVVQPMKKNHFNIAEEKWPNIKNAHNPTMGEEGSRAQDELVENPPVRSEIA